MTNSIVLVGAGILDLYFTIRFIADPDFSRRYVVESPKAWLWRKIFGAETTTKLVRYFFAPIGIALGILLIYLGIA